MDQASGAASLTVGELLLDAGSELPLHRHSVEEGIVVLSDELEFLLGDDVKPAAMGDVVHAPAGVAHGVRNRGEQTGRVVFAFPALNVEREWVAPGEQ